MALIECCEFTSPIMIGDSVAVITINAGSPDVVNDIAIYAEGCDCGYSDTYDDEYCDASEGGSFPNARITDTIYTLDELPAGHSLIIDAVERVIKVIVTDSDPEVQIGGLDALEFSGVFQWIESAFGGCQRVCIDGSDAHVNADTTIEVETYDREL